MTTAAETASSASERFARIDTLYSGSHEANGKMCAMEAVAFVAGEPWSDHPECSCPVIGAFMRAWNDGLPDKDRTKLLLPLIPRLVGTRGSKKLEERRALMAADWLVRAHTPAWLRLAGLMSHADALSGLPEITAFTQVPSIRPSIEAARESAAAAWDAAGAAARDAAWAAAWAAARAAARDAAWDAAWAAARAAARAAAWDATWDATWAAARDAARDAAWDAARAAARAATWDATWAAAWAATWAAAWAAARAAARAAAWDATWAAARDAARAAARAATWAAAWDAAGAAARKKLAPTRAELQKSALALVERMIAATNGAVS